MDLRASSQSEFCACVLAEVVKHLQFSVRENSSESCLPHTVVWKEMIYSFLRPKLLIMLDSLIVNFEKQNADRQEKPSITINSLKTMAIYLL